VENGAEAGVRRGRWGGEASTGSMKMTSIGTGQVKAEELDSPLASGAGVIHGGVSTAAEGLVCSREETE
jgi:hypothetical protein